MKEVLPCFQYSVTAKNSGSQTIVAQVSNLRDLCASRALVSVQNPIQLNDLTEPQPDFSLVRRREDFYASAIPLAADGLLIVEFADTSLAYDRREKVPLDAVASGSDVENDRVFRTR